MEHELIEPGKLLNPDGSLAQVGWSRQPLLDCNLENARFYRIKPLQFLRIKRWDYYAVFTPRLFFSATIAHLGYAGNIFVYVVDFEQKAYHEEGLVIPMGRGIELPRNSDDGVARYEGKDVRLFFHTSAGKHRLEVSWKQFEKGRGIEAEVVLNRLPKHESMNIVIPFGKGRFYFNRKINCMPAEGFVKYGERTENLLPNDSVGSLDWGRGIWEYRSFWNWASASGFLPDRRTIGLNLGRGFGDTSRATENAIILDGRIHKLGEVTIDYTADDYMRPWRFTDVEGRLNLTFTPFLERVARTNLGIIFSEVHQMFGHYSGTTVLEDGAVLHIDGLRGFAEEHHARW